MDARITKARLSNLLAYDWLKIIITIVVAVFAGVVVLSTIGTKPTDAQRMHLIFYKDLYVCDDFSSKLEEESDDIFSYEVFTTDYLAMSSDDTYSDMALTARYMAGRRSMLFSSTLTNEESGTPYVDEAVSGCISNDNGQISGILEDLEDYMAAAKEYAGSFYGGDYVNGNMDEEYLSAQFTARVKGDKRYKNDESLAKGIEDEKERIAMLRSSLITIYSALEQGVIEKYSVTVTFDDDSAHTAVYAFKIGTAKTSSLVNLMYFYDSESGAKTSDGICVCIYRPVSSSCNYMRFEALNYIAYLINTYAAV